MAMNLIKRAMSLIGVFGISVSAFAELVVEEGYVRDPIPGRSMTAAFMTLSNTGAEDFVLKSATLEGAASVEIHTHTHDNGVMRMRQIHELVVKAGESVVLKPGGLHLMIFGIKQIPENPELKLCDEDMECITTRITTQSLVKK
ncbi:MAG TPA: hypothetical protein DIC30_02600 [Oceanospirillales bacterium]|jgi:copper(I)-binding protein|nr:hypothetical protein [Oleispira sp.]HCM04879.1 hypothetical protein [Oceanospirillales bacterium]|tara:strand:+ start:824 stop:1255 length:432 start_codon:yes stop_codon:yes gene_type:complete